MTPVLCQVVGLGPAALGLPVAADRLGLFGQIADLGLVFVERAPGSEALRAARFPYVIESNSVAADFLAGLSPVGQLAAVLRQPPARALASLGSARVSLPVVRQFLDELMIEVETQLEHSGRSGFRYGHDVTTLRRDHDGTLTSLDWSGQEIVTSRTVVLAMGAEEDKALLSEQYRRVIGEHLQLSGEILSGRLQRVRAAVASGGSIVVLGASHSGFSVARLIADEFGDALGPGQLTLLYRRLCLFFQDAAEALPWRERLPDADWRICPDTGLVNRFSGLRGRARQLAQDVLLGREPRVRLVRETAATVPALLGSAALVAYAAGYRGRRIRMIAESGEVQFEENDYGFLLDGGQRLLCRDGQPVDNVYGLGLGYTGPTGERHEQAAINFYHGGCAESIVVQLAEVAAGASVSFGRQGNG